MARLVTVMVVSFAASAVAAPPAVDDPRVATAMALYAERADLAKHEKAARLFSELAAAHAGALDVQIWCARTAYYCAHRLQQADRDEAEPMAALAHECGERLSTRFAGNYDAELWAILARAKHMAAKAFIPPLGELERLTRKLEEVSAKSPDRYGAHMMLGAIYRELPGWPLSIGDDDKSLKHMLAAVRLEPNNAEVLLELAATYKAVDETEKARATYEKCISQGTGQPELGFEAKQARDWAKKMLQELD